MEVLRHVCVCGSVTDDHLNIRPHVYDVLLHQELNNQGLKPHRLFTPIKKVFFKVNTLFDSYFPILSLLGGGTLTLKCM